METCGIIILAAGASTRLGRPKQLLQYNSKALLRHVVETALQVRSPVFVILGAYSEILEQEVCNLPVHIVENLKWKQGMASSIFAGVDTMVRSTPLIDTCILMVCDQPFVSSSLLLNLITTHQQTAKAIVASAYENTLGTPALFNRKFFDNLLQLKGVDGAKKIINNFPDDVESVQFPMGSLDIDTAADYEALLNNPFVSTEENI